MKAAVLCVYKGRLTDVTSTEYTVFSRSPFSPSAERLKLSFQGYDEMSLFSDSGMSSTLSPQGFVNEPMSPMRRGEERGGEGRGSCISCGWDSCSWVFSHDRTLVQRLLSQTVGVDSSPYLPLI